MFDIQSAIKDACADFTRFKEEMVGDPANVPNDLVKSVQTITKQGCLALGFAGTFGISIPKEVKEEVLTILHYFLHDGEGVKKLALLSSIKKWDFEKNFSKLSEVLKQS